MRTSNEPQENRPRKCTGIIVAGGMSRRMGTDKTQLTLGKTTLIEYVLQQIEPLFDEILISANDEIRFETLGCKVVNDRIPGKGPIMGLISSIEAARHDTCFVQACDIPKTDVPLLQKMLSLVSDHDAVVPKAADGRYEPLFAVYRKNATHAMTRILERENGRCSLIPDRCNSIIVKLSHTQHLFNLNTQDDYKSFLQSIANK